MHIFHIIYLSERIYADYFQVNRRSLSFMLVNSLQSNALLCEHMSVPLAKRGIRYTVKVTSGNFFAVSSGTLRDRRCLTLDDINIP